MIEVVSATRASPADFWKTSPLGLSLSRLMHDQSRVEPAQRLVPFITDSNTHPNTRGLPLVYNQRIQASDAQSDYLIFVHDDVWIDDFFIADHVVQGLEQYDVIGVAGNRRRGPNQPAWMFIDDRFTRDDD